MADLDRLLDGLLAAAAPSAGAAFAPPPVDGAVAEAVLGASGAPGTPHRRLLERRNGLYAFDGALHLFGACADPPWHGLAPWNAPSLWRDAYGDLADGLSLFAEDAFGDQYAYSGVGGEVVVFEAELGRVRAVAPHFVAWLEAVLAAPESGLPVELVRARAAAGEPLRPGAQLYAWPPLCTAESRDEVAIGVVDAVEAMRVRGQLARQLGGLPVGTRVKIDLADG